MRSKTAEFECMLTQQQQDKSISKSQSSQFHNQSAGAARSADLKPARAIRISECDLIGKFGGIGVL